MPGPAFRQAIGEAFRMPQLMTPTRTRLSGSSPHRVYGTELSAWPPSHGSGGGRLIFISRLEAVNPATPLFHTGLALSVGTCHDQVYFSGRIPIPPTKKALCWPQICPSGVYFRACWAAPPWPCHHQHKHPHPFLTCSTLEIHQQLFHKQPDSLSISRLDRFLKP